MSHEEKYLRRVNIKDYIKEGHTLKEAIKKFKVSKTTIYNVCKEFNIHHRRNYKTQGSTVYEIIGTFFNSNLTQVEIAKRFFCTSQRINNIYRACINAKIPIPEQGHTRRFKKK